MKKNKKRIMKKSIYKQTLIFIIAIFLIVIFNIIVYKNNLITPEIDEITTSYVSLYNQDTTDMLKITNIEKMTDSKGKSKYNNKMITLKVTSEEKNDYEVFLYEIQNNIPEEYIKVSIKKDNKVKISTLDKYNKNDDGGRSIYFGHTRNDKIEIKMWVSEEYKEKINDTSFELRVKKR